MAAYPPFNYGPQQGQMNGYQQPYQQPYYQQQAQSVLRPVTCKEEALAASVDFMGGISVMPDLAHGVIYTKVFDRNTGSAAFAEYRLAPPDPPPAPAVQYAPLEVVEQMQREVAELRAALAPRGRKTKEVEPE